jgi:hypothetical protein
MSETNEVTAFDPAREPIDFLPLRPWEVRKTRLRLVDLQERLPASEPGLRAIEGNVIDAHRAALDEYDATSRRARWRRSSKRLASIRQHRSREVIPRGD